MAKLLREAVIRADCAMHRIGLWIGEVKWRYYYYKKISTVCCSCLSDVASSQHDGVSHPIDCLVSYHLADRSFLHILQCRCGPGDHRVSLGGDPRSGDGGVKRQVPVSQARQASISIFIISRANGGSGW